MGLPGFVAAYVLGAALTYVLLMATAQRRHFALSPCWNRPRMKDLLLQARPFALLSIASTASASGGNGPAGVCRGLRAGRRPHVRPADGHRAAASLRPVAVLEPAADEGSAAAGAALRAA